MNEEQNALDQLGQTLLDVNTDAAIDLAELAADGSINDEVIKDIPIIRGVYGSLKSVKAIAEYYSRIKLYKFVMSVRTAAKRNHPVGTFGTVASVVSAAGSGTDINRNN